MYERTTKSGMYTRPMVTKDSDLDRVIAWGLKSDRTAVTDSHERTVRRRPARRRGQNQDARLW